MNQSAPLRYATLSLTNRSDAAAWEKGCAELGFTKAFSCIKEKVSVDEVMQFFAASADWAYLRGHSLGDNLFGENTRPQLDFKADAVTISEQFRGAARTLRTDDQRFKMRPLRLVVFGGCAPFVQYGGCAPILRMLFGGAAILGTASLTSPKVMEAMFGGMGAAKGFFASYRATLDPVTAWMSAAQGMYAGAPPAPKRTESFEENFRAIDAAGQHWKISNKQIVKAPPIQ